MGPIRRVIVVALVTLVTTGGLVVPATAQSEDSGRTVHETGIRVDYRFGAGRFVGAITSSFATDTPEVPGCLAGRQVTVQFSRADGSRRVVGTTLTDETGSFRLRAPLRKGMYFARVEATEFAYSPSYGVMVEVVCAAGSARMRSTRTHVLGLRVERGATEATGEVRGRAGRLPVTGLEESRGVALVPLGVGLIVMGSLMLTVARRRPQHRL